METINRTVTEVTEREWMELFECLPPAGWHSDSEGESWYCPEMYSGNITTIGVRIGEEYYLYKGECTAPHIERINYVRSALDDSEVEQSKHAQAFEEHGEAWHAYCGLVGEDYAEPDQFEEAYQGEWDSERAYSDNLLDECYPEIADGDSVTSRYFNYDAFCRDLFMSDCSYVEGHVFNNI